MRLAIAVLLAGIAGYLSGREVSARIAEQAPLGTMPIDIARAIRLNAF